MANIRSIDKFNNLLRILSEQSGSLLNVSSISNATNLTRITVEEYLMLLENTYVIKRIYPYHNNVKSELIKMPKVFFQDTRLMNLLNYREFISKVTGQMLENVVYTMLRKRVSNENIYYWRTKDQHEIDFVIKKNKKITLFEVKLRYTGQSLNNILYFMDKYKNSDAYIVTLEKAKYISQENIKIIYPWELFSIY